MHVVPGSLPPEPTGKTRDLRNWYMSDELYLRLDAARERRYPKSSTMTFALWLMETALTEYEAQEKRAKLATTRLVDTPPQNQIIVRD